MKAKLFVMAVVTVVLMSIANLPSHKKNFSDILLDNIEAVASNTEISFDFCMYTSDLCVVYPDGFAIKGNLQYSGSV